MGKSRTTRATKAQEKAASYLSHKAVPYVLDGSGSDVNKFLPSHSRDALTAARVAKFVDETRHQPDTRLAVLGILRSHASNGAEVPLSAFALMASAIAILAASQDDLPFFGWIVGIVLVLASAYVGRISVAAHIRRITCLIWLGAYEDALEHGRGAFPFRRTRR